MNESNQFPKEKKDKTESLPINTRAKILLSGLKKNLPDLYKYITSRETT